MEKIINKREAKEKILKLETEIEKLREILNRPTNLFETIKEYSDVCIELNIKEKIRSEFDTLKEYRYHQIQNIAKLFNGDNKNNYWYPYFTRTGSGLVFPGSFDYFRTFDGPVAYFKDKITSDFIGKTFIKIYTDLV